MKKVKRVGIDARMCGQNFTGIGRLAYEIITRLPSLMPKKEFVFFGKEFLKEVIGAKKKLIISKEPIYSPREQTSFLSKLWKADCDLMLFLHFNVPYFYRRPFAVVIHDLTLFDYQGKKFNKWWQRLGFHLIFRSTIKRAKKIITVSQYTKDQLISRFGIDSNKISVIYNGISRVFSKQDSIKCNVDLQKQFGINHPYFLYAGVWREHKNLPRMIEAFSHLVKDGLKANLVITGNPDPNDDAVQNAIEKFGVKNEVILTGLIDDNELYLLFQNAKVFVFPSLAEGFGIPPIEAMSLGVPVCVSNATCLPEVCGGAANYFDPLKVDDMANVMKMVFVNKKLRQDFIKKGKIWSQKYVWKKAVFEYRELINILLK